MNIEDHHEELLEKILRDKFDFPRSVFFSYAKSAEIIDLAIALEMSRAFVAEMVSDFKSETGRSFTEYLPEDGHDEKQAGWHEFLTLK